MQVTYGYNGQKYWGRAHRTGCQDIRREDWQSGPVETEAESLRELIEEMASDFIFANDQQPWTDYETEISIAPCLTLPREAQLAANDDDIRVPVFGDPDWNELDEEKRLNEQEKEDEMDGEITRNPDFDPNKTVAELIEDRRQWNGVVGTSTIPLTLPYNLTPEEIVPEEEGGHLAIEQSLDFLCNEADSEPYLHGERETIIIATAALLQTGVPLDVALSTAIIWERG